MAWPVVAVNSGADLLGAMCSKVSACTTQTRLDSISEQKTTGLGIGLSSRCA